MRSPDSLPPKRRRDEDIKGVEPQPAVKPQKRQRPASNHSPQFWDSLSVVHLTKNSLAELDSRLSTNQPPARAPDPKTAPQRLLGSGHRRLLRSDGQRLAHLALNGRLSLDWLRGYADMSRPQPQAGSGRGKAPASTASSSRGSKRDEPASSPSRDADLPTKRKTTATTPYDLAFEQKMTDAGVFPNDHSRPDGSPYPDPANFQEILARLACDHHSLATTSFEAKFREFSAENKKSSNEPHVMGAVLPILCGDESQVKKADDVLFRNLEKFDAHTAWRKPDRCYGATRDDIPKHVRHDLEEHIIPSKDINVPVAPNVFVECKGHKGSEETAERQAMYNGAIGARAMLSLQNYSQSQMKTNSKTKKETKYDGNAYTLSMIYVSRGMLLVVFATYPLPSIIEPGRTDYHMKMVKAYRMAGDLDLFRQGMTAYRNARDWGAERRDDIIGRVKGNTATATGSS